MEWIVLFVFLTVSLAIAFQHKIDDKRKIICLLVFELLTALLYLAWLSPSIARHHSEMQTTIPICLLAIHLIALVVVTLRCVISHKSLRGDRYMIYGLGTLVLWSAALLCIGRHTSCPICDGYWFYDWMAEIDLMNYPLG